MPFQQLLEYAVWLAGPVLQIGIIVMMVRRGLRTKFTFLFNYFIFQALGTVALFVLYRFPMQYFFAYWVFASISILLEFAVMHEVFSYAMRPYSGLRDLGVLVFRWAAVILLLVGVAMAMSSSGSATARVGTAILNIERSIRLMQCGLLAFMFVCSHELGLKWKNFANGVSIGFGVFAFTDLMVVSAHNMLNGNWNNFLSLTSSFAFLAASGICLGYCFLPEAANVRNEVTFKPIFDRWNQAAMALLSERDQMMESHLYIDDIQHTVEAVMARNH
jgi:hypothetical protein